MSKPGALRAGARVVLLSFLASPAWGQASFSEIFFDPVGIDNFGQQKVEITNAGATPFPISGHWLNFPPSRWQFPAQASIPPGGLLVVHLNKHGTNTATDFYTGTSGIRDLLRRDALALHSTNVFTDPQKIIDFVQWGGGGNGGEDVADAAGIWVLGSFVNVDALRDGASIAYDGSGNAPGDWCVDGSPSPGTANDSCAPSLARSPVILNEVGMRRDATGTLYPAIELKHIGDERVLEDLGGKWVTVNGEYGYQFPQGTDKTTMRKNELVVVHLGVSGQDGEQPGDLARHFYGGTPAVRGLMAVDGVSFHALAGFNDPSTVIDFVQWGGAGTAVEAAAVGAGVWTAGEFVQASDLRRDGCVAAQGTGAGVPRWVIDNTETFGKENGAAPEPPVVLNEVLVDPSGENAGQTAVELKNVYAGGDPIDVSGYTLCTESRTQPGTRLCYTIPAGKAITPGGLFVVGFNNSRPDTAGTVNTGPFQDINPAGGSLLLFVTSNVLDVNNAVDFMRWGVNSSFGESTAVLAGIWPTGKAVSVAFVRDSSSLSYVGAEVNTEPRNIEGPEGYRVDETPSLGEDNDEPPRNLPFRRGDCNENPGVDLADAIRMLEILFTGSGKRTLCPDVCDSNDDGSIDISDPVSLLNYLFQGGKPPPAPGSQQCGLDPTPEPVRPLTCSSHLSCP